MRTASSRRASLSLFMLLALGAAGPACTEILGDYTIAEQGVGAPCSEETQLEDCGPVGACYIALCFQACSVSEQCGPKSQCSSDVCVADIGTSCKDDSLVCGPSACIDQDVNNLPVEPYCTLSCYEGVCPSGFQCVDYDCRLVR